MKKFFFLLVCATVLLVGCQSGGHFLREPAYRQTVAEALRARLLDNEGALLPFYQVDKGNMTVVNNGGYINDEKITQEEAEALDFLYAYMPLADVTDYPTAYFLQNIRASFRAREEMPWGDRIPEMIFRHFVLPVRVNNESLDTSRVAFFKELKPRVEGLPMAEAILEVNHWCHEKVTYQPSDARTTSPLATLKNAYGRCGEESTFTVAALRSVGIPARQVYTPRWAHTDDNHAWVEAWADGQWYFFGACEPEAVLDLGWFNAPASRALLMHTKVFGHYEGPEEVMLEGPNYTEINLIDHYAETARADFRVVDADGAPVAGACVDFMIYNYAEFYPAVKKYTDADGRTFLTAGKGDMIAWASKDGRYGYARVRFGTDTEVVIMITDQPVAGRQAVDIVPPPEKVRLPEVSEALKTENARRLAQEDSIRQAYEATFATRASLQAEGYGRFPAMAIEKGRGNWMTLKAFLDTVEDEERAMALLESISWKDLRDITMENLMDSYEARDAILNPRVANEFLTPYKAYFNRVLTAEQKTQLRDPQALIAWTRDHVKVLDDPAAWQIPQSPRGVYESGLAFRNSRDVFFVSLARTLGIDARLDPVTGKVQYRDSSAWTDVDFEAASRTVAPQGTLVLRYAANRSVPDPKYYSHFTISRIEDGRTRLLTFDEGQVDMGGGVSWNSVFRSGVRLDAGTYILVSGNRVSDGSVPASAEIFTVREGAVTTLDLVLREAEDAVSVIGEFNASLAGDVGRGFFVAGVLEPGKEPTNHALRDIAKEREAFETWGRPVVLFCPDQASLDRLQDDIRAGVYGTLPSTLRLSVDRDDFVRVEILANMDLKADTLPLFVIADTFNKVYFCSQGYTIGLGERIHGILTKL